MRIGFDFDKVFVNYPPLIPSSLIDLLYKKKNHKLVYRIPGTLEQKIRILSHISLLRQPIKRNVKTLSQIVVYDSVETYLISGRFGFLKKQTENWIKKHKIDPLFKKKYFNFSNQQPHIFKNEIIQKLNIEMFIDDDLDLLLFLAQKNPNIDFFWVNGRLFEPHVTLPNNIISIKNLEEFKIKHLENNSKFKVQSSKC